jgi:hypothetical protein
MLAIPSPLPVTKAAFIFKLLGDKPWGREGHGKEQSRTGSHHPARLCSHARLYHHRHRHGWHMMETHATYVNKGMKTDREDRYPPAGSSIVTWEPPRQTWGIPRDTSVSKGRMADPRLACGTLDAIVKQ